MDAVARHSSALRRMSELKAPSVEFVLELDDYDPETDGHSNDRMTTVVGHAVELDGDPSEYKEQTFVDSDPITPFFIPNTIGEVPLKDSQVLWNDRLYSVRKVRAIGPLGRPLGARVVAV